MSRFVLTAQLQLQSPNNTRDVIRDIERQLGGGLDIPINLGDRNTPRQINELNRQVNDLNRSGRDLSRTFGLSIRRFAGFTVASRAVSLFTNKLAGGFAEAIKFEREIVKIAQVTGKTVQQLDGLTKTITNLSTSLGVASSELVGTTRILAQAGIKANDLEVALAALAKTTLAPTFEDITKTAEGAVAILAQFGQGVGALEDQLGSINRVAGQFAVESGDLISAVRRFGGVFKSAGGELDELLGLFTSVRATTRESAESIATGLRTIFTRIQRPKTIEFLKQFGVELTDLEGKFVGPFEAVRQLSQAFAGLEEGDITFVKVAEELGGFRQIGKVIPLIQQFTVAEQARQAALEGRGSLDKDAATAQQALAVQIAKVKEEFFGLIRGISETGTFQTLVKTTLDLTSALIGLADAFKPLIPFLTLFAGFKIAGNIGNIARGIGAGFVGRNQGGPIPFATGGVVPGTGNRDTVPAMLTPGEFVIRKSSVNKIGAGTLAAMNENKFAAGGLAKQQQVGIIAPDTFEEKRGKADVNLSAEPRIKSLTASAASAGVLDSRGGSALKGADTRSVLEKYGFIPSGGSSQNLTEADEKILQTGKIPAQEVKTLAQRALNFPLSGTGRSFTTLAEGISQQEQKKVSDIIDRQAKIALENTTRGLAEAFSINLGETDFDNDLYKLGNAQKGNVFEDAVEVLTSQKFPPPVRDENRPFDFTNGVNTGNLFRAVQEAGLQYVDAKVSTGNKNENISKGEFTKKVRNQLAEDLRLSRGFAQAVANKNQELLARESAEPPALTRNSGGGIPGSTDTVPALLTPGEFVINKKAAQSIGTGNLNRMNKQGVVGFAKGGSVGIQKFNNGGPASGGAGGATVFGTLFALQALPTIIDQFSGATDGAEKSLRTLESEGFKTGKAFTTLITGLTATTIALQLFGLELSKKGLGQLFGGAKGKKVFGKNIGVEGSVSDRLSGSIRNKTSSFKDKLTGNFNTGRRNADLAKTFGTKANLPKGIFGRLGGLSSRGGLIGKAAGFAGRAGAGAVGAAGGAAAGLAALAGPALAVAGGIKLFSAALTAGFDAQGKYNRAIKEGNVEKAKEFAVLKEASGIAQLFGEAGAEFEIGIKSFFGGSTLESIKALAEAAATSAAALKTVTKNQIELDKTLRSLKDGAITLEDAFASGQVTTGIKALQGSLDTTRRAGATNTSTNQAGLGRDLLGFLPGVESSEAKNARLSEEEQKANKEALAALNKEVEKQIPLFRDLARETIRSGGSLEDFLKNAGLEGLDRNSDAVKRVTEEYYNQIPALKRAAEAAEAINLGLTTTNRVTTGLNTQLNAIANPASKLEDALSILEGVSKGATVNARALDIALATVNGTLEDFGSSAAATSKIEKTFKALGAASNGAERALSNIKKNFAQGGTFDAQKFSEQFAQQIAGGDTDTENILSSLFADFKPSQGAIDNFINGNFGKILEELQATGKGAFDELLPSVQAIIDAQTAQAEANRKLIKAKEDEIAAIKRSLDLQQEAAAIIEEFGGKVLTSADKVGFLEQKLQADLGPGARLDAGSLRAGANASLRGFTFAQGDTPVEQAANEEARNKAKRTQEATLQVAQERIKLYREEIAAAKERLKLEQDAAQALLANDIAKFAENINASIAASAFRTGDTTSLQALGGDAVAAGFASLTDTEKKAARPQLEALGLSSGLADAAAGTSPEIQALEAEARKFATVIQDVATNLEKIAELERQEAERRKELTDQSVEEAKKEANARADQLADNTATQAQSTQVAAAEAKTTTQEADRKSAEDKAREEAAIKAEEDAIARAQNNSAVNRAQRSLGTQNRIGGAILTGGLSEVFGFGEIFDGGSASRKSFTRRYNRGGTVYASRGMFIPRGTDTVPAMLTPGEFVVNRAAVQRGNNLQILRSMNGGDTAPNGSPAAMSKGGSVGYYNQGGEVAGGMGEFVQGFTQAISQLGGAFGTFSQSVQQLAQMKLSVDLAPTRVDVNVIGPMLSELTEATKEVVLNAVVSEIQLNQLGQLERTV